MPRLPRPRGFDIRDEPADCYDATGRFSDLAADSQAASRPDEHSAGERSLKAIAARGYIAWLAAVVACVAGVALLLSDRAGQDDATPPTAPTAPVTRPRPEAPQERAVVSSAGAAHRDRVRPTPGRRHRRARRRHVRPSASPGRPVVPVVRPPAPAPVASPRRPKAQQREYEPAGEEFVLGAR